ATERDNLCFHGCDSTVFGMLWQPKNQDNRLRKLKSFDNELYLMCRAVVWGVVVSCVRTRLARACGAAA
ncbi:MAG: hypothetical protein ACI4O9_06865, partial [Akkermansia sp.]